MQLNLPVPELQLTIKQIIDVTSSREGLERDHAFRDIFLSGNVPSCMRSLVSIDIDFKDKSSISHVLTLHVLPDYLTVGTDEGCLRFPLDPLTAQEIADQLGCILPTTKIVDKLWQSSKQRLSPQPWGPPYDASMYSMKRICDHDARVNASVLSNCFNTSELIVGHKKDVVITNRMAIQKKKVAIYGWTLLTGNNIQPLSLVHEDTYRDYSHGIRLVSKTCQLDGVDIDLIEFMKDSVTSSVLSGEGVLKVSGYVH